MNERHDTQRRPAQGEEERGYRVPPRPPRETPPTPKPVEPEKQKAE